MIAPPDWDAFRARFLEHRDLGISLDLSRAPSARLPVPGGRPDVEAALDAMQDLEAGGIANPDEGRQVGHYWLRDPDRAPDATIAAQIRAGLAAVKAFAAQVHTGRIPAPAGGRFRRFLLVGIGGSALGPQLADAALSGPQNPMQAHFLDNTDPDGFDIVLGGLGQALQETLVVVVSKSGGTRETRNAMLETRAAYTGAGLDFARHAVAVTGQDSVLDRLARQEGWLRRFPLPDWVGGRTSQTSVVGLLPAALAGVEVDRFLAGARKMDAWTRSRPAAANPAACMALAWHHLTGGHGERQMVVLPYKDRLAPLSRYLQQLVMESLGKERDLQGQLVHQGLTVYGNKGSTDQHAYVQQLRDGRPDFFATFLQVLQDREGTSMEVEPGVTAGDYLSGFLLGTRQALFENGRESLTLCVERVDAASLGAVIALFERTVGLYASLIGVNAYHQPGVEAGKKAAAAVIALQRRVVAYLRRDPGNLRTVTEIAAGLDPPADPEAVFHILRHLAANPGRGVRRRLGADAGSDLYGAQVP